MNIKLLENNGTGTLLNQAFINNHATLKKGMVGASAGFILLIGIAVYKPWMKKQSNI